ENTSAENLRELIRQLHSREDIIYASPIFLDELGYEAGGYTNQAVVQLKSKDDYSVLQKCAGDYFITEIKSDEFDELKYMLTLPRNSKKNTLDIAKELHKTDFFEYALPDMNLFGRLGEGNSNTFFPDQRELRKENSPFIVYPNPANDVLYIDIDRQAILSGYSTANPACELNIYNLHGSKALQIAMNSDNKVKINVSVLQNGIYFLHLYDIPSGKQEIRKIMIKH
ncbi:MAG: T9SS type A sorting domain-containing protein, partial [Tannerella sp.]|nr:T9SS type A sorting domain-containing protein [Tannerella sp.]